MKRRRNQRQSKRVASFSQLVDLLREQLGEELGSEMAKYLQQKYGGKQLYLPKVSGDRDNLIRAQRRGGASIKDLACRHRVSDRQIQRILAGQSKRSSAGNRFWAGFASHLEEAILKLAKPLR